MGKVAVILAKLLLTASVHQALSSVALFPTSITRVHDFNTFLLDNMLENADKIFEAIPQSQISKLYNDFLQTYGSVSDNGQVVHTLANAEYDQRIAAFKASIYSILQLSEQASKQDNALRPYFGITSNADWSSKRFADRMGGRVENEAEAPDDQLFSQFRDESMQDTRAYVHQAEASEAGSDFGAGAQAVMSSTMPMNHTGKMLVRNDIDLCNNPGAFSTYCHAANPKAWAMTEGCTRWNYWYGNADAAAKAKANCERASGRACYIADTNGNTCPNMNQCGRPDAVATYCHAANPKAWAMTTGCTRWQYYYNDANAAADAKRSCESASGKTCEVVDTDGNTCPPIPTPAPTPPPPPTTPPPPAPGTCGISPMNDVRNQGRCGSCWAFTTAEMMRYQYQKRYNGEDPGILSAQYLVDCAKGSVTHGCNGGNAAQAIRWMIEAGGIPTATAYGPYLDRDGTCKLNTPTVVMPGPAYVTSNEDEMYEAYCAKGPFSVMINGNDIKHYSSGVMTPASCSAAPINHLVLVIGVTVYNGMKAWVIQNSWGPWYGATPQGDPNNGKNGGYILMEFGVNTCGIQHAATFPADIFSAGGPHPWTHSKPLLQWSKRWGPYTGIEFQPKGSAIHKSSQGSLAECEAAAEQYGDSLAIYRNDGSCDSTSGAWQVYSGAGPVSTLYISGKPIDLLAHIDKEDQSLRMPIVAAFTSASMFASLVVFFVTRARQKHSSFSASEPLL